MQKSVRHRVYGLPMVLFLFLATLFVSAGIYLEKDEKRARISKAQSVAEQVKISLEVFSNERVQALHNLMRTWPTFQPNQVDWFNAQAVSLMGMQRGFSSLTFANENKVIQWVATPTSGIKQRLDNSLIGHDLHATGLVVESQKEAFDSALVYSELSQHHYIMIGRAISPQEPEHGYIAAGFDMQTILGVMLGELVGPQFNFKLTEQDNILFSNGELVDNGTVVTTDTFPFIDRQFTLSMQSIASAYSAGGLISVIGLLMSALVSWIFHKQLKGAVKLSLSQQRYLTASEASLDALLIYQPVGKDYKLVEANRYTRQLFRNVYKVLTKQTLSEQLRFLGNGDLFEHVKGVWNYGTPYEKYVAVKSTNVEPEWLKLQVVKAGDTIALTARDVTGRFKAEKALKHNEERYRRLVDGMHRHFVYTKTAEHKFVYVSAGIETILGYSADEFCEHEMRYLSRLPDETLEIRATIASGKKTEPYLVHYIGAENKVHVLEFSDTPILNEHGQIVAVEGIARDVTKEQALQAEVAFQANHDQLTGLMNRYAFDNSLKDILSRVKQEDSKDTPLGVMCFVDMDRFKLVNDSCGHPAGDRLLQEVSNLFRQNMSKNDLLARIGGDEFCFIFKDQSLDDVTKRLDKLLVTISNYRFVYDDKLFFVGASIGVIEITSNANSAAELIKAADNACYKAKHMGRNRYFVYQENDEHHVTSEHENDVLNALHKALQFDGFELFSQAIVPLGADALPTRPHHHEAKEHFEILLRLSGSDGKLVSPALFIPLAERHGLMNKVDIWVVENTLKTLEKYPAYIDRIGKVAINLSGLTLGDDAALKKITQLMQGTNVPAEKVCFEITETTAVTNIAAAKLFISTLSELGCSFALDDFGAGMSSFTYLKNLDVDYVKIDGSFVRNIVHDPIDHATVKAINSIAHSMGKQTVAEFVVDNATCDVLRTLGVDYAQGFALDKPKPLSHRVTWKLKLLSA